MNNPILSYFQQKKNKAVKDKMSFFSSIVICLIKVFNLKYTKELKQIFNKLSYFLVRIQNYQYHIQFLYADYHRSKLNLCGSPNGLPKLIFLDTR